MIRHIWSVLCHTASIDRKTNSTSLLNILETMVLNKEPTKDNPATLVQASLVSLWIREELSIDSVGKMRAYIIAPDGNKLAPYIELDIFLKENIVSHRTRIDIKGTPLPLLGQYNFHIDYKKTLDQEWQTAAIIPLMLRHVKF